MGCCAPNAIGPGPATADPCKRVNYTLGMLLGVDDFVQETAYHSARRRELARELVGYGTVHGLQVVVEPEDDQGPRVRVMPGMAWLPSGTPVCVDRAQCANLNDWLATHQTEPGVASPDTPLTLYLVLSHAHCLTDNVPIPGEPCRDDADLMQPSRVTDSFRLELRLAPPFQREEDAIRDFVAWLLDVPLDASSPPLSPGDFVDQLRAAAHAWLAPGSPSTSPPDFMLGSAPAGTSEELLATALRLWATELRPLWMARADCGCNAEPIAPKDDAVLLAELQVSLVAGSPGWQVSDAPDAVRRDESRRPYVLSLRMLQELITLHPVPDPGDSVEPEMAFGQAQKVGTSLHYARADHTHGTPELPPPPILDGDVSGPTANTRLDFMQGVELVTPTTRQNGQVLTLVGGRWTPAPLPPPPAPPTLDGDVSGPIANTRIDFLQGVELVTPATRTNGHVMTLVSGRWTPSALPAAPPPPAIPNLNGDVTGTLTTNGIVKLQNKILDAVTPNDKDVLRFVSGKWVPDALSDLTQGGQFVGRGHAGLFHILGAADVIVDVKPRQTSSTATATVTARSSYAGLRPNNPSVPVSTPHIDVTMVLPISPDLKSFIVKLTPVWTKDTPTHTQLPFRVFLLGEVFREGTNMQFEVRIRSDSGFDAVLSMPFRFHAEVSNF